MALTADAAGAAEVDFVNDFDRVYAEHYQSLYRAIRGIVLDPTAAEDLTQEAFVKAYRARHRWRPEQAPRVWLHRIGVNTAISYARHLQVQGRLLDRLRLGRLAAAAPDPTTGSDDDLVDALGRLAPAQRATVVLHYYHGYPYAEIAEILGIPTGTVGSRISAALQTMRSHMAAAESSRRGPAEAVPLNPGQAANMRPLKLGGR